MDCEDKMMSIRKEGQQTRKDAMKQKNSSARSLDIPTSLNTPEHLEFEGQTGNQEKFQEVISEQNINVENLQQDLSIKEKKLQTLTAELKTCKEQAKSRINALMKELEEYKIKIKKNERPSNKWTLTSEKLFHLKKGLKEEFKIKISALTEDIRKKYDDEINRINLRHNEIIQNYSLKESFLKKQIELLSNRVTELYEIDKNHDTELEASRKIYEEELSSLKVALEEVTNKLNTQASMPLQGNMVALNNQLAEALTREITLKAELSTYKKNLDRLKNDFNHINNQLKESSKNERILAGRCWSLEKTLDDYKEQRGFLTENLQKWKKRNHVLKSNYGAFIKEEKKKRDNLLNSFNNDLVMLNDALAELRGQISSLVNGNRSRSDSSHESVSESDTSQKIEKYVNHLIQVIRKNYEDVLNLGDFIGNLNADNQQMSQENDMLKTKISEMTKACEEKEETFKSQLQSMGNEIESFKKEVSTLGNKLKLFEESSEKSKLTNDKEGLLNPLRNYEDSIKRLQEEMKQLNVYNVELKSRIQNLEDENLHLGSINTEFEARNSDLLSQIEVLTKEINSIRQMSNTPGSSDSGCENNQGERSYLSVHSLSKEGRSDPEGGGGGGGGERLDGIKNCEDTVKWMEQCSSLEQDNLRLVQEIQTLKIRLKDFEFGAELVQQQLKAIEMKKQLLESKVEDYISLKKQMNQLTESNKSHIAKLQRLEELNEQLLKENKKFAQDKLSSEKKFATYFTNQSPKDIEGFTIDLIGDLNEKIHEVVNLKEQIFSLQNERNNLLAKLDLMTEAKNISVANIEELAARLQTYKEELDVTLKEKLELSCSKNFLEKQVSVLNLRVDYLDQVLHSRLGQSRHNLVERIQQELIKLYKKVLEENMSHDKIATKKELKIEEKVELDAKHRMEILMTNNLQLQNEKSKLLKQLVKWQKTVHTYEGERSIDPNWTKYLIKLENDLIHEVRSHKEQFTEFKETLQRTGVLHDEIQKLNGAVRFKTRKIFSLTKKVENQHYLLQNTEMRLRSVEKEMKEKDAFLESVLKDKKKAENKLFTIQKMLLEVESSENPQLANTR